MVQSMLDRTNKIGVKEETSSTEIIDISDDEHDQVFKQEIPADCMPILEKMQYNVEMASSEVVIYISDEDSVDAIKEESISDDPVESIESELSSKTHNQPHDFQATYDLEESMKKVMITIFIIYLIFFTGTTC